ncbi:uncharacterized protein LOC143280504 [Babylonia areolata]|uniref:uncharacterized protein LOC143280504 n=1 Tax=Babylonia areolata TaxID=304850 RepID=UPI003FD1310A
MVSIGAVEGRQTFPYYWASPRRCCCLLLVVSLLCCGAVYLLVRHLSPSLSPPPHLRPFPGHRDPDLDAAKPFVDFIDPDLSYLPRMFYSGGLALRRKTGGMEPAASLGGTAEERGGPLPAGVNVTVFHGQAANPRLYNNNNNSSSNTINKNNNDNNTICVPFHAPGNRTLRICVYDREVDQMISAHLQDHGVWEKEQVEAMAHLLRRDDADMERAAGPVKDEGAGQGRGAGTNDSTHRPVERSAGITWALTRSGLMREEDEEGEDGRGSRGDRLSVVDVGCNLGVYTLAAASLGHTVLAVDPVRPNLRRLDTSLRLAQLRGRVTLLLNAVSDHPGPVRVNLNPGNVGGSSVSELPEFEAEAAPPARARAQQRRRRVPTVVWALCLNHLVPLVPGRRVLLKLDIEGMEARALRCAAHFFQRLDVRAVLMEWLFLRHRAAGAEVVGFMLRNGLLPYSDVTVTGAASLLHPGRYYSWPDNVWWVKR